MMRYNGNYGARDSRGRYMGEYGRRGVPGSGRGGYRGYGYLDEMSEHYGNYNDSKSYGRGSYGAQEESVKELESMLKLTHQFIKMLKENASSPEEEEVIQEYSHRIGDI